MKKQTLNLNKQKIIFHDIQNFIKILLYTEREKSVHLVGHLNILRAIF